MPLAWHNSQGRGSTRFVAVELPDTPWGRSYYALVCQQLFAVENHAERVPCMLCSMADFRGPEQGAKSATADCLRSLLTRGRPPLHFARFLDQEAGRRAGLPAVANETALSSSAAAAEGA